MVIHSAGDVTNIICERPVVEFEVRAFTMEEFYALYDRVAKCFEAGALATGSTDMGNITQVLPGLHPWASIPGVDASIHAADFATAADTEAAYDTMFESGVAMAWAVAGLMANPQHVHHLLERKATYQPLPKGEVAGEREVMELMKEKGR